MHDIGKETDRAPALQANLVQLTVFLGVNIGFLASTCWKKVIGLVKDTST